MPNSDGGGKGKEKAKKKAKGKDKEKDRVQTGKSPKVIREMLKETESSESSDGGSEE